MMKKTVVTEKKQLLEYMAYKGIKGAAILWKNHNEQADTCPNYMSKTQNKIPFHGVQYDSFDKIGVCFNCYKVYHQIELLKLTSLQ